MATGDGINDANTSRSEAWRLLAIAAQGGDKDAYRELLNSVMGFTRSYLFTRVANPDWVEDITQDVLISVHKSLKTYSDDRPFTPWLMAIIKFRKTDFLRKHYASRGDMQTTTDDLDFQKEYVTNPNNAGEYKDIENALASLPEKQRHIFELLKIHGFSVREVADKMDMTESAVKVSAHRTTQKLQGILEG